MVKVKLRCNIQHVREWDKENLLVPQRKLDPRPPTHGSDALAT